MIRDKLCPVIADIVIASPHRRNDHIEDELTDRFGSNATVHRARTDAQLRSLSEHLPASSWFFFPHWSTRVPDETWRRHHCIMFHMTDLPFGRGGSPLQNLIMSDFRETVMTAFICGPKLDTGDILLKAQMSLEGTASQILERASGLMVEMIAQIIEGGDHLTPRPQVGTPTMFKRRTPEMSNLADLEIDRVEKVYDFIRMLDADGYPRAYIRVGRLKLVLHSASLTPSTRESRASVAASVDIELDDVSD